MDFTSLELGGEELVALLEGLVLLEGEGLIGPMRRRSRSSPGPARRGALGQRRALGGHGRVRLDVEVAPQRLDVGLEAQPGLGVLELGPLEQLARPPAGGARRRPLRRVSRQPTARAASDCSRRRPRTASLASWPPERSAYEGGEAVEGGLAAVELVALGLGCAPLGGVAGEALLELVEAAAQELAALVETGARTSRSVRSTDGGGLLLDGAPGLSRARPRAACSSSTRSSSGSWASSSATRRWSRSTRAASLVDVALERLDLGAGVGEVGLDPPTGVVGAAGRPSFSSAARRVDSAVRRASSTTRASSARVAARAASRGGGARSLRGLVERGASGPGPPTRPASPTARSGRPRG